MKYLRIGSAIMFGACFLLSFTFGIEIAVIASEVIQFNGETEIRGKVLDQDGVPIQNVSIDSGDMSTRTDGSGIFELKGIPQGKSTLELYKDGYVGVKAGILSYPDEGRWNVRSNDGPNDLTKDPFILYEEIEWVNSDKAGKFSLVHGGMDGPGINSTMSIMIIGHSTENPIVLTLSRDGNQTLQRSFPGGSGPYRYDAIIVPGVYDLTLTGKDVLDRGISGVELELGSNMINITTEEQSFLIYGTEQEVQGNILLGAIYIIIALFCLVAVYLVLRTDRWIYLVLISILAFFGRGTIDVLEVNIMSFFSFVALVLTILLREDMVKRRSRLRILPSVRT